MAALLLDQFEILYTALCLRYPAVRGAPCGATTADGSANVDPLACGRGRVGRATTMTPTADAREPARAHAAPELGEGTRVVARWYSTRGGDDESYVGTNATELRPSDSPWSLSANPTITYPRRYDATVSRVHDDGSADIVFYDGIRQDRTSSADISVNEARATKYRRVGVGSQAKATALWMFCVATSQ